MLFVMFKSYVKKKKKHYFVQISGKNLLLSETDRIPIQARIVKSCAIGSMFKTKRKGWNEQVRFKWTRILLWNVLGFFLNTYNPFFGKWQVNNL